jgi:hypothetical protein
MKQDRFLIGILIFIGLLVVAALVLFFTRNEAPAYGTGDSPEGVIHNYVVALQKGDFERAYTYLADEGTKPNFDVFISAFMTNTPDLSNSALQIDQVQLQSGGRAVVSVTVLHAGSGPFDSGWSSPDRANLVQQSGEWKLTYLPYPYWGWDWYTPTPAPVKP